MNDTDWPPWHERVATRLPFWRREGLLLFPLGILAVVTANAPTIDSGKALLGWVLAAVVGATAGIVFVALFPLLFTRHQHPRLGAIAVLAAASGTGAVFALGVSLTARQLSLPDTDPLWWRVLGSAVIVGWFAVVLTLALDARSRLRLQRDHLVDEAIALESARLSTSAISEELHRAVAAEVETALTAARDSLENQAGDSAAAADFARWPEIAAGLRATASETVRPLSRQLWESAPGDLKQPRPWSLLAYIIGHQPLRPLATSVIYALSQVSILLQPGTTSTDITQTIMGIAAIWVVMASANALMRHAPRHHSLIFVSAALLLQVPVLVKYLVEEEGSSSVGSPSGVVATIAAGLIVILATSAYGAVRGLTQERLDSIATRIDVDFVESAARARALAQILREASAIVHGAVQARLLGCAIAIEAAGQNSDPEQFSSALARARSALEHPLVSLGRATATSLADELSRRRELWDGLCEVTFSIADGIPKLRPATVADCGRIIEEAISNAVRHGDAQHVVVDISISPLTFDDESGGVRITVTDDGQGLAALPVRPGLGLRMIQSSAAEMSLTNVDGHAQLTVDVPTTR